MVSAIELGNGMQDSYQEEQYTQAPFVDVDSQGHSVILTSEGVIDVTVAAASSVETSLPDHNLDGLRRSMARAAIGGRKNVPNIFNSVTG